MMEKKEYSKKDDITYHFNKDEYSRQRRAYTEVSLKSKPFKDNKTLLIILLDIGVILLFALIIMPLLRKPYSINNFNGYSLKLSSFISEGKVFAVLDIRNNGKNKEITDTHLVNIRFSLAANSDSFTVSDILPGKGESRSYSHFFAGHSAQRVYAAVKIGNKTMRFRVKITE